MKVIIDTDPGTDDAIALVMALNSPDLEVLGLTTVGGNASLSHTTRNALRMLEYMGRADIPVHRGASRPLRGKFQYAYHHHGPAGLTVRLPLPRAKPRPLSGADYLINTGRSLQGDLALIALGPLTNVARALAREPQLGSWLKEVIVMGGAVEVPGNVTPHAEFNIYDDTEAANIVFSSGVPVTLVGLDVCGQTFVTREDKDWLSGRSIGERLTARILSNWFKSHGDQERYHLCDPLAIVAALRPELFSYKQASMTVETEGERRGKTSAAYRGGNVNVSVEVEALEAKAAARALLVGDVNLGV